RRGRQARRVASKGRRLPPVVPDPICGARGCAYRRRRGAPRSPGASPYGPDCECGKVNTILIISNGHGEDLLGALLARQLAAEAKDLPIAAYPVVGEGGAYRRAGVEVVGVQK